jgi:glutamate-1-semialdehyde 2,1-aminomutase
MISDFSRSDALYKRAVKSVPLASQTFSKSALNLVQGASPLFLEKGEGGYVYDVDGNRYIDFVLGLLPIILGYCDPEVDKAITEQLKRGISFSLATDLEVRLSEKLVDIIPCAEKVRFGKNGSDATSAAIRLARAKTGRDRIVVCGYHGWHDWYIGSTTRNLGVPKAIQALTSAVPYNDVAAIEKLIAGQPGEIAAIILEPAGPVTAAPNYLKMLRHLCDEHGIVLVFDEIVSGFRLNIGGAQSEYGVVPHLACFGKAMGNGMPISAIVGLDEYMAPMEDIFFSGTFGGEALSLAASLATIDKLEQLDAPAFFRQSGIWLADKTNLILERTGLETRYHVKGPPWRPLLVASEQGEAGLVATSLLRQELIANGVLMGAAFNLCTAHDETVQIEAVSAIESAAEAVSVAYQSNNPSAALRGQMITPIFQVRNLQESE